MKKLKKLKRKIGVLVGAIHRIEDRLDDFSESDEPIEDQDDRQLTISQHSNMRIEAIESALGLKIDIEQRDPFIKRTTEKSEVIDDLYAKLYELNSKLKTLEECDLVSSSTDSGWKTRALKAEAKIQELRNE